jgi:thiamine-monophosphate kinase
MPYALCSLRIVGVEMDLQDIGEFGLIDQVRKWIPITGRDVVQGIGDDVAVIALGEKNLLVTTDILIEGTHFHRSLTRPYDLGKKSLMVNLSDVAAMGGTPKYFLLSLGLPRNLPFSFVSGFYRGLKDGARRFHVDLVGGDTSLSSKIVINICLLGEAKKGEILFRKGANPGDDLYVSGTVGDSSLGLKLLQDKRRLKKPEALIRKHLSPIPRVELGQVLGRRGWATAMIDVSDGLLIDTTHLLEESGLGGRVWLDSLPLSRLYRKFAPLYSKDPYHFALSGGEDYELLFTAPPSTKKKVLSLAVSLGTPITRIGRILPKKEGFHIVRTDGTDYSPRSLGFEHFR